MNKEKVRKILEKLKSKEITPEEANKLLLELKKEKGIDKTTKYEASDNMIAIIGMSGKFPGANNIEELWKTLCNGEDQVVDLTQKWGTEEYYDPIPGTKGKTYSKWGGIIKDVDKFDPLFFNISPKEASEMDPQQRIILEESWKALEDAGYTMEKVSRMKCGVFIGAGESDYHLIKSDGADSSQTLIGKSTSFIAARISYFLNLHGACMTIDTACSSSLVAINQGFQSLQLGESELVIAGGSCILNTPQMHIATSQGIMLAKDGKCKAFDNSADGFVPSEAVGIVILKPLKKALQDHDNLYGVILGSEVNQDGKSNGITAPNGVSQTNLEVEVYEKCNINPKSITYVEAHGTGTKIGDPIEISALTSAFQKYTDKKQYCAIGSVKSNIGHALSASGVVSLIKTALCMKYKKLVPSIHYNHCNEHINFQNSPFYVNTEYKEWKGDEQGRHIAAISSFGLSGTNVHMVVEAAPVRNSSDPDVESRFIIPFSAKTKESLEKYMETFLDYLVRHREELNIGDIAFTMQSGRSHFKYRHVIVTNSVDDCIVRLKEKQGFENISLKEKEIVDAYLNGKTVDWEQFELSKFYYKISLPTYQFDAIRCWKTDENNEKQEYNLSLSNVKDYLELLKGVLSNTLNIEISKINENDGFDVYGIDSIVINDLNLALENIFGELPKTLFFTYKNLASLANYFASNHIQAKNLREVNREENKEVVVCNQQKTHYEKNEFLHNNDIAIVGLSGHYPMADDLDIFWNNIETGRDCIEDIPKERWDYKKYYNEKSGAKEGMYCHWGGFLKEVDKFDPIFFHISPLEAKYIDPQERLFLEAVWECLEDAGIMPENMDKHGISDIDTRKPIGVFAGATYNNYQLFAANQLIEGDFIPVNSQLFSLANRVSYIFDFKGPSIVVDTACSSSLSAIHMACESIKNGECEMAIAGGVNLSIHPSKYMTICIGQFGSTDGRCRAFGEGGDGYVPAEGVGAILLKPLEKALEDEDHIYGVIKGTSMNHGGKTYGFTVPNPVAQEEVIVNAIDNAGINPRTISYLEAHGTGTSLGDPIEIEGLTKAFSRYTMDKQFCPIGSVKSNIGHGEAVGGLASLTKVLLQFKHKKLVPSLLHSNQTNTKINFSDSPFYVQTDLTDWKRPVIDDITYNRRAGISSFGAGGVNAHIIVEEYEQDLRPSKEMSEVIICISAEKKENLQKYAARLATYIKENDDISMTNLAYTLQVGRKAMKFRYAFVANNKKQIVENLIKYSQGTDNCFNDDHTKGQIDLNGNDRNLFEIAKCWETGGHIDWEIISKEYCPRRISLPTYVFSKEHYWIGEEGKEEKEEKEEINFYEKFNSTPKGEQIIILKEYLQSTVARILDFGSNKLPGVEDGFFDMGMDSIQSAKFFQQINEDFKVEVYSTAVFDFPNIKSLAEYIMSLIHEDSKSCATNEQAVSLSEEAEEKVDSVYYVPELINEQAVCESKKSSTILWLDNKDYPIDKAKINRDYSDWYSISVGEEFCQINNNEYVVSPFVPEDYTRFVRALVNDQKDNIDIVHLWSAPDKSTNEMLSRSLYSLYYLMKEFRNQHITKYRVLYLYDNQTIQPFYGAISSFFKSLYWENKNYQMKSIGVDMNNKDIDSIIEAELTSVFGRTVQYKDGVRYIETFREILKKPMNSSNIRRQGVYLITGGSGALGMLIARYLMTEYQAKMILVGRRQVDETIQSFINEQEALGNELMYIQTDITNQEETNQLLSEIRKKYGCINGIIHAAGIIIDNYFVNKTMAEFNKVISPKIHGAICLDEATKDDKLDFFVLFSSLASTMGNGGQVDYAYGNSFMDHFATWRNKQIRSGKTISINWPLWRNGGMKINKEVEEIGLNRTGISIMETEEGLNNLEFALSSSYEQLGMIKIKRDIFSPYMQILKPIDTGFKETSNEESIIKQLTDKLEYWGL